MQNHIEMTDVEWTLRRKYARHWRHLNPSYTLGQAQELETYSTPRDDYGDYRMIKKVKFIPRQDKRFRVPNVIKALEDSYTFGGCDHQHDCCGCASGYADVIPWPQGEEGEYMVSISVSHNY